MRWTTNDTYTGKIRRNSCRFRFSYFDYLTAVQKVKRVERSALDPKSTKYVGYYITGSAIALLVLNHYVSFMSLLDYYEGLAIDSFIFYMGLKVIQHE